MLLSALACALGLLKDVPYIRLVEARISMKPLPFAFLLLAPDIRMITKSKSVAA